MSSHWYLTIVRLIDRVWRWEHLQNLAAALTSFQPIHHSSHSSSLRMGFSRRSCWEGPRHAIWSSVRQKAITKSEAFWVKYEEMWFRNVLLCFISKSNNEWIVQLQPINFNYFHYVKIVLFLLWNFLFVWVIYFLHKIDV